MAPSVSFPRTPPFSLGMYRHVSPDGHSLHKVDKSSGPANAGPGLPPGFTRTSHHALQEALPDLPNILEQLHHLLSTSLLIEI